MALSERIYSKQTGLTNLYVFSVEPQGFVIVSALGDILAYSPVSIMPPRDALPDHISYWIDLYNEAIDHLFEHPEQRKETTRSQTTVEPLLTSCWNQGCFHNEACPVDHSGPCQHVEAGCVAIAMAQIMYYHKSPLTGNGEMTYTCVPYGTLTANFGQTTYQWEEMVDTLHESNPAVATLVSHCGISVRMKYSSNGSGAHSQTVPEALQHYFYYPAASYDKRVNYDDEQWEKMIRNDLDKQHPVFYDGTSSLGEHAFVCDGYDDNGMFHFNFGWKGIADGYYTINSPYGFSIDQSIVHNIFPVDNIPIHSDSHGIIYVTPDGTGDGSSWAQATSELQLALLKSTMDNSKIWVKEGTYTGNPDEEFAFTPLLGCKLYGGFKGDEPYDYDLSQRDLDAHPSILDGSHTQGVIGETTHNNDLIIIDGFTIQNGNAKHGGGILLSSNTLIRNCKFCYNHAQSYGGAISQFYLTKLRTILVEDCEFFANEANSGGAIVDYGNTSFSRCVFHYNHAINDGGGVYCISYGAHSHFFNCTFSNNLARQGGGIAVFTTRGPSLWNCLINNNTAETGGGCYITKNTDLYNCTIVKNEASEAYGGVYCDCPADIRNCIIWGNTNNGESAQIGPNLNYSYSAVENDPSERGNNYNIKSENDGNEPAFYVRFKNPILIAGSEGQGGDWRLQPNSPCIDRVDDIANQPSTDLDDNPRHRHNKVDLGAYESDVAAGIISNYLCDEEPYYYQDSLLSDLGCYSFPFPGNPYDSLVIVEMIMPPNPVKLSETICENETYDFFGTLLNQSGTYQTVHQCVGYKLHLTVNSIQVVHLQEEICDHDIYDFFGTPLTETGHYSHINDCKRYELDLTVKPTPLTTVWLTETICEGDIYDFHGRLLVDEGHYSAFRDCNQYELDLTVAPLFKLHCSHDTIVRYQDPVTLSAWGADTYLWSTGDTTSSITVSPVIDMTYTVRGFSEEGCEVTKTIDVKVTMDTEEIVLFPNPAQNILNVYMPLIDEVEILNLFGECVRHAQVERDVATLDVSNLPNGIYIVHVRELYKHFYRTFVICH